MVVSFKPARVATTAATLVSPAHIIAARLFANTTADVIVHLHDAASTAATSASTRVGTLFTTNPGVDETGVPIRLITGGCVVVGASTTNIVYVYVR